MKRFNLTLLLAVCLGSWAAAQPVPIYQNIGLVTNRANIDATAFVNRGVFYLDTISSGVVDSQVFQTQNTLSFNNSGTMMSQPGFNFFDMTGTGPKASSSFYNTGTVIGVDSPPVAFFALGGSTTFVVPSQPPGTGFAGLWVGGTAPYLIAGGPGINTPIPSSIVVSAANLVNSGRISVGDLGVLTLNSPAINLSGGILQAGTISETDTNATAARGVTVGYATGANVIDGFFDPAAGVYDIYWSVTNGASELGDVADVYDTFELLAFGYPLEIFSSFPQIGFNGTMRGGSRNGTLEGYSLIDYHFLPIEVFPMSTTYLPLPGYTATVTTPPVAPQWTSYVYSEYSATAIETNYINMVFVNTAFADPDISVQVQFSLGLEHTLLDRPTEYPGDEYAVEPMIRISAPVLDVTTGQTVSNSIYFLDTSAIQVPAFYFTNSVYNGSGCARPNGFEITRNEPVEWADIYAYPPNDVFDPFLLYYPGEIGNATAPMTNSFYCAQVGRNPETPEGLFDYTATLLGHSQLNMPALTQEGGRLAINASSTVLNNAKLSANGVFTFNSPSISGTPAGTDFGNMNVDLGKASTPLVVSHLFPSNYHRLRGDLAAITYDWVNLQTNNGVTNVTNYFVYHVLVVDQDLRDNFQTTGLNVKLRGSSMVVNDPLRIMQSALFQATNLTLNSSVHLVGAAGALQNATMPGLKNLYIGSNGSLAADNYINLGVAASASLVVPTVQNTPILSIINLGNMSSGFTELQSRIYVNGGTNVSTNNGAMVISAISTYLGGGGAGLGGTGLTNVLAADGDIDLTSTTIVVTNSTISAGHAGTGRLVLHASGSLSDHYPNTASTNVYHTNIWRVTGGFSLPVKPGSGDLFGTQITSLAAVNGQSIDHVWAGQDLGASVAGFFNNEVIGHLILDRTSASASFRFSGAGTRNAMYVDYLEMQDLSSTDYQNGLTIDGNMTIYFASSNVEPGKLHKSHPRLVWVPQFAGPNSTTNVAYLGGSNCLMNAALAASSDISTDGSGTANLNSPYPLNNTNLPGGGPIPCPSLVTSTETLSVAGGVSGQTFVIWTTGQGFVTITPNPSQSEVTAGKTLTLTATPASSNWLFLGWSGATNSSHATIRFVMPTNSFDFLTANFIPNPFINLAGRYNGLFSVPAEVTGDNSGFVTFTLNSSGVFSGNLRMGATNYPFSSQFNIANEATFTAATTNGRNVLTVSLQLTNTALPDQATGSVTNTNFDASLVAWHVPGWTAAHPAPQAGSYTLVLPGNGNSADGPGGDSYGTVTVDALGNLTAAGTLANGVSFSQSVPVSKGGQWALYFTPSGMPQPVLGWVSFDTNGARGTSTEFNGAVTWVKAAGPGAFYPQGFTNTSLLLGSKYAAAYQRTNGLALNNPSITLSGGNLAVAVTEFVQASGLESYKAGTNVTLTINPTNGLFSGQYIAPGTSKKIPLAGAVLQNEGEARGFFLGTNQSGAVLLKGN